jgi:hypothetical protein
LPLRDAARCICLFDAATSDSDGAGQQVRAEGAVFQPKRVVESPADQKFIDLRNGWRQELPAMVQSSSIYPVPVWLVDFLLSVSEPIFLEIRLAL